MAGAESREFARFHRYQSGAAALALLASFAAGCASHTEPPAAQPAAPPQAQAAAHPTVRDIVARSAGSVVVVRTPLGLGTGTVSAQFSHCR